MSNHFWHYDPDEESHVCWDCDTYFGSQASQQPCAVTA